MEYKKELLVLPAVQNIDEIIKGITTPIQLTKGKYANLQFRFKNNQISLIHNGVDLNAFNNVWLSSTWGSRDLAYAVRLYLDHFQVMHTYVEKVTSKVTDQVVFAFNNISMPDTFFIDECDISGHILDIEDVCSYPLIIKDITGFGGRNSVYVNNRTELIVKTATLPKNKKYLFQKYIPNDYDWGILVANGKIVSAEKSYPKAGEFRNNCNGATEVFMQKRFIPREIQEMALRASKALNLSWSRSDIIVDKDTNIPYLMEVNRCPGISSGTMEVFGAQNFLETHLNCVAS